MNDKFRFTGHSSLRTPDVKLYVYQVWFEALLLVRAGKVDLNPKNLLNTPNSEWPERLIQNCPNLNWFDFKTQQIQNDPNLKQPEHKITQIFQTRSDPTHQLPPLVHTRRIHTSRLISLEMKIETNTLLEKIYSYTKKNAFIKFLLPNYLKQDDFIILFQVLSGIWQLLAGYFSSQSQSKGTSITNEVIINYIWKTGKSIYQIKRTESPATSLFALTKTLHPVVRRCLFGWPAYENRDKLIRGWNYTHWNSKPFHHTRKYISPSKYKKWFTKNSSRCPTVMLHSKY